MIILNHADRLCICRYELTGKANRYAMYRAVSVRCNLKTDEKEEETLKAEAAGSSAHAAMSAASYTGFADGRKRTSRFSTISANVNAINAEHQALAS
jgi:hypothetical protein